MKIFKEVDITSICQSKCYVKYGNRYLVKYLAWSVYQILGTCDDMLRNKIHEGLVGVSELEASKPLISKMMLDIVMEVDNSDAKSSESEADGYPEKKGLHSS